MFSIHTENEKELEAEDIKKLSEFFYLLDKIDRRIKREGKGSNDK